MSKSPNSLKDLISVIDQWKIRELFLRLSAPGRAVAHILKKMCRTSLFANASKLRDLRLRLQQTALAFCRRERCGLRAPVLLEDFFFSGTPKQWLKQAPLIVALCSENHFVTHTWPRFFGIHYELIDLGIAGEPFVLQAQELGLGTWDG
jgi:nitroreductase